MTNEELVSWENLTREIELPPYEEWEQLSLPEDIDEHYNKITEEILNDNYEKHKV